MTTSEISVDEVIIGCCQQDSHGCDKLFNELTRDKTGEKCRCLKEFMKNE